MGMVSAVESEAESAAAAEVVSPRATAPLQRPADPTKEDTQVTSLPGVPTLTRPSGGAFSEENALLTLSAASWKNCGMGLLFSNLPVIFFNNAERFKVFARRPFDFCKYVQYVLLFLPIVLFCIFYFLLSTVTNKCIFYNHSFLYCKL